MKPNPGKIRKMIPVLIIRIGEEVYAVKAATIEEVVPIMSIQKIPDLPLFLEGIIDIRSILYAVVDLCKKFGGERQQFILSNRIILMRCHERNIAFIVDEILRMEEWHSEIYKADNDIENSSRVFTGEIGQTEFGNIPVLDLNRVLSKDKILMFTNWEKLT